MAKDYQDNRCIFCNGKGLSKQHLWPNWIGNIIPREENTNHNINIHIDNLLDDVVNIKPQVINRQGHAGTRKLRNVCTICNNGWMSELEQVNKANLTALILGQSILLNKDDLLNIAEWAVMTSYVREFEDLKTKAIKQRDVLYLMKNELPPKNWKIYIGRYQGTEYKMRYRHIGVGYAMINSNYTINMADYEGMNTQYSTFVVGELIIHASCTYIDQPVPDVDGKLLSKLNQVWPLKYKKEINLHDKAAITDIEADNISNTPISQRN
ncbi:hypothetical protein [Mucilaginibacter sp.]|uniref:hypothetical protein n=1 Tax=Mucilaginibacter sp. TaxID=1882438 RepID=UPI0032643AF4